MRLKKGLIIGLTAVMLAGCGTNNNQPSNNEPVTTTESPSTQEVTQAVTEGETESKSVTKEGMLRSRLTGEWIDEDVANQVPLAIMINNHELAVPQSGLSNAEIVYEAYVEGMITRLLAVIQDYNGVEKIGPVRSCREYYVHFAKEYDAIYVHFGFSAYAIPILEDPATHAIDGNEGLGGFYRVSDKKAPHNAYSTAENLIAEANKQGYSLTYGSSYVQPMTFNEDDDKEIQISGGQTCVKFTPGFKNNSPYFVYNDADGLYYRYQYGAAHVDETSGEQLAYKNILVKYVEGTLYENGTPNYTLTGTGEGLYITNGAAVEVTWKNDGTITKYYYLNGEEVVFNQGKTFINIIDTDYKDKVEISSKK